METELSQPPRPLKLLVVDDEADDAELISLELKRSGLKFDLFHTDDKTTLRDQLATGQLGHCPN